MKPEADRSSQNQTHRVTSNPLQLCGYSYLGRLLTGSVLISINAQQRPVALIINNKSSMLCVCSREKSVLSVVCLFPVESLPVKEPGKTSFWLVCWACLERPHACRHKASESFYRVYVWCDDITSEKDRVAQKKTETENRNEALGAHNRRVRVPSSVNALRVYFF